MKKNKKNKNLSGFIVYISFIFCFTILGVSYIYIKEEIEKTQYEIEKLHEINTSNTNIVKELQSNKEFLMSEKYISNYLSEQMTVVVPETLIIEIEMSK